RTVTGFFSWATLKAGFLDSLRGVDVFLVVLAVTISLGVALLPSLLAWLHGAMQAGWNAPAGALSGALDAYASHAHSLTHLQGYAALWLILRLCLALARMGRRRTQSAQS